MASRFDVLVVGGGIIGLATAVEVLRRAPAIRLLLVEKEARVAAHQTGHNSGVIHSGIYYSPGTVKASTCVTGAARMLAFCARHGIPSRGCGKVIVATEEGEFPALKELERRAIANQVPGVRVISRDELLYMEPHSRGLRALHVPGTAVTDFTAVAAKLAELIVHAGGAIRFGARVIGLRPGAPETIVETTAGSFAARQVVTCAGLHSDRICKLTGADVGFRIVPFRGEYYELVPERTYLVRGLIYPVPDPRFPFLGVHFTPRVYGGVEAGPNAVLAFKREGYRKTDFALGETAATFAYPGFWRLTRQYWRAGAAELLRSLLKAAFVRALQRLVPEIAAADLRPAGTGVRAQALDQQGRLLDDYLFVSSPGLTHVCNVPSPAATACLAIARHVVDLVEASGFPLRR